MTLPAWLPVILAVPVLLAGEALVRRIRLLARFNIPAPVVGGLLVAATVLAVNLAGAPLRLSTRTDFAAWTWLVTAGPEWVQRPAVDVHRPFLVAFFTCIGLSASWLLVKPGSVQVLRFWALASLLALIQNVVGVALARGMNVSPLLGLMCGSVSMTGGHGTALGFAAEFERAGLTGAPVIGMAAATFGLVAGGLMGGPLGGALIRRRRLTPAPAAPGHAEAAPWPLAGIWQDLHALARHGRTALWHIGLVLACVKLGAWVSYAIQQTRVTFPVYMGALLLGVAVRNGVDLLGRRWLNPVLIQRMAFVALGFFLTIAMMSLNLVELAHAALPMLAILTVQVAVMGVFAWFATFPLMGRDFDAAVMTGGHCGFGLGATPNAVANMKALVERFGPAPRAFLVVPVVGAFLIDFANATIITVFLNLFTPPP